MNTNPHGLPLRSSRLLAVLSWLAAIGSLAIIAALLLYVRGHDSNHTSFEPWLLSVIFLPAVIAGIAGLVRGGSRWGAFLACGLGFGGMVLLLYVDCFNVLVQYDRLAQRGGL